MLSNSAGDIEIIQAQTDEPSDSLRGSQKLEDKEDGQMKQSWSDKIGFGDRARIQ